MRTRLFVLLIILFISAVFAFKNINWLDIQEKRFFNIIKVDSVHKLKLKLKLLSYNMLPLPDDAVIIKDINWKDILIQWVAGKKVCKEIGLDYVPIDPETKKPFLYVVSINKDKFSIYSNLMESDLDFWWNYINWWRVSPILNTENIWINFLTNKKVYQLKPGKKYKIIVRWEMLEVRGKFITEDVVLR